MNGRVSCRRIFCGTATTFSVYLSDVWTLLFKKTLASPTQCEQEVCFFAMPMPCRCGPWLEGGPHRIFAFTFCLLLPPYCAEFGELRLTLFSACCHQGRAWARAAPYLTQPVLFTEAVKTWLFVSFLLKQPGRASHCARTVPATVPAQCPLVKTVCLCKRDNKRVF